MTRAAHEARRTRIAERVANGEPITRVAVDEGISRQRVSQIIHERGLYIGESRQIVRHRGERETMKALANAGLGPDRIASWFGRSRDSVRSSLRRVGVRFTQPERVPRHGTASEYNAKCRCEPCRAAHAAYHRAYKSGPARERESERVRAYIARHPERRAAWQAVDRALRNGQLIKPSRCACGRNARVNAHHDDYARPLDVLWLCGVCHKARHATLKRQLAA